MFKDVEVLLTESGLYAQVAGQDEECADSKESAAQNARMIEQDRRAADDPENIKSNISNVCLICLCNFHSD